MFIIVVLRYSWCTQFWQETDLLRGVCWLIELIKDYEISLLTRTRNKLLWRFIHYCCLFVDFDERFKKKTIGSNDVEFIVPLKWLTTYHCQRDLTLGVFRNIHVSKMRTFANSYLNLHFQGHLLQELDGQTKCDKFGENLIKIAWMLQWIFRAF